MLVNSQPLYRLSYWGTQIYRECFKFLPQPRWLILPLRDSTNPAESGTIGKDNFCRRLIIQLTEDVNNHDDVYAKKRKNSPSGFKTAILLLCLYNSAGNDQQKSTLLSIHHYLASKTGMRYKYISLILDFSW
jgi:hypothetical protein